MRVFRVIKLAVAGVILAAQAGDAGAGDAGAYMVTTGRTSQPIGHYEFCRTHASECGRTASGEARVGLTPGL